MIFSDQAPLRGSFEIRVYKAGQEIEHYCDPNMIMASARDALARLIGGDGSGKTVTRIGVGTNGNGPSVDDTGLTSAYTKAVAGHTYPATGEVAFAFTLGTGEANGKTIKEFGLLCSDGTLFARKTRGAIVKADDIEITGSWTIKF